MIIILQNIIFQKLIWRRILRKLFMCIVMNKTVLESFIFKKNHTMWQSCLVRLNANCQNEKFSIEELKQMTIHNCDCDFLPYFINANSMTRTSCLFCIKREMCRLNPLKSSLTRQTIQRPFAWWQQLWQLVRKLFCEKLNSPKPNIKWSRSK